jgi:hypothetical protein
VLAALLLIVAAPTSADVQSVEETRVLQPLLDYTPDGRAYVEFAPTVETRNVACTAVCQETYECSVEARVKNAFDHKFGAWTARLERMAWRDGHWHLDTMSK